MVVVMMVENCSKQNSKTLMVVSDKGSASDPH
jgi:hypothetical protein